MQYERNFRAKLAYFRAQCATHLINGHAKLTITREGLLEESFQQVHTYQLSFKRYDWPPQCTDSNSIAWFVDSTIVTFRSTKTTVHNIPG